MSLYRMPKYQRVGNTWESIVEFFNGGKRRRAKGGRQRRLMIDPLEERMLLTLTVGNPTDNLVNAAVLNFIGTLQGQTTPTTPQGRNSQANVQLGSQYTDFGQAVAIDHNGDFVVAWTRVDPVIDNHGNLVIDPTTSSYMTDANIYARYYTDEVQRIVLPAAVLNGTANQPYSFSLLYGGNAVQKISFSAGTPEGGTATNIVGYFSLSYGSQTTNQILFDETNWASLNATVNNAQLMQNALRALGGVLADVQVQAIDARDYLVVFGDASQGMTTMPLLTMTKPAWSSGFLPSAIVSWQRQPTLIGTSSTTGAPTIFIHPTDPSQTATSIEQAFAQTAQSQMIGAVSIRAPDLVGNYLSPYPEVKVTSVSTADDPLGLRTFDITFVGDSGKQDQPLLMMHDANGNSLIQDAQGNLVDPLADGTAVKTLKQCSPVFRVNPEEPDNIYTPLPDKYNQINPAVAMDADGDFVITWESEVPDSVTPGSKTDIFARRFTPQGLLEIPNLVISSTNISVAETGSKTIMVSLASQPTAPVTVNFAEQSGGDVDLTLDTDSSISGNQSTPLYFDSTNWYLTQPITINAAADTASSGPEVNGTAKWDVSANGFTTQTITATEVDRQSFVITNNLGQVVNNISVPEGGTNTFYLKLGGDPGGSIRVGVASLGGDPDLTLPSNPTLLNFDSTNWNTAQTVTIKAAENAVENLDYVNGTASFSVSATTNYAVQTVTATEVDNDVPSLVLSTNTVSVIEGGTNTFGVSLAQDPGNNVTVNVERRADSDRDLSDPVANATTGINALTFTGGAGGTWNTLQFVTINAAQDADHINGTSYFDLYVNNSLYPLETVTANEIDVGQFVISDALGNPLNSLMVPEGGSGSFYVRLSGPMASNTTTTVAVSLPVSTNASLTVNQNTLTFTPNNWNTRQMVTVSAAVDTPNAINGTAVVYINAVGYQSQHIAVMEQDIDISTADLIVVNSALFIQDGGTTSFTVQLAHQPTLVNASGQIIPVAVSITRQFGSEADITAVPGTLTFNDQNWNTPQTVTINSSRDADGNDGVARFNLSTNSTEFPPTGNVTVTVMEIDNDLLTLNLSTSAVTVIEGGMATFTVSLPASAPAPVAVTIARQLDVPASNPLATTPTLPLTFTLNPGGSQPVTLTAVDPVTTDTTNDTANFYVSAPGYTVQAVAATQIDTNGTPVVVSSSSVSVAEGGYSLLKVHLAYQPLSNMTVTINKSPFGDVDLTLNDTDQITPGYQNTLVFTPSNWNVPQTLIFYAAEDGPPAEPVPINGSASFVLSSQMGATAFGTRTVTVREVDNDFAPLVVSTDFVPVLEGSSGIFTVALPSAPLSNVTVTITRDPSSDADLHAVSTTLTLTPTNYKQTVEIVADADEDTVNGTATFLVSATGYLSQTVTASEIDKLSSVRPLAAPSDPTLYLPNPTSDPYTFRVNTFTANGQFDPAVAMDEYGNFVISWTNEGQFVSYYNNISARRFSRDGTPQINPITNNKMEWSVTNTTTVDNELSYAAMSEDGHFLITWTRDSYSLPLTPPYGYYLGGAIEAVLYNLDGSILAPEFNVGGGGYSTASFDRSNNFIIGWTEGDTTPHDTIAYNVNPSNTYARMYALPDTLLPGVPVQIRSTFRVNSADLGSDGTTGSVSRWSGSQGLSQVSLDADGDVTVSYEGIGPDIYQDVTLNADLTIEQQLAALFATNTNAQLGRIRAQLEQVYSVIRGEANGIMFSQFNTDPQQANNNLMVVDRDSVANAERDGDDQRVFIFLDSLTTTGTFTIRLTTPDVARNVDIQITPIYLPNNGPIDAARTQGAIEDAIRNQTNRLGLSWARADGSSGSVSVVDITSQIAGRTGTYWDFSNLDTDGVTFWLRNQIASGNLHRLVYEVDFQGDSHDKSGISLTFVRHDMQYSNAAGASPLR